MFGSTTARAHRTVHAACHAYVEYKVCEAVVWACVWAELRAPSWRCTARAPGSLRSLIINCILF